MAPGGDSGRHFLAIGSNMADKSKTLREELEAEFECLKEFGVTPDELEALYEMCGLKPRRTFMLNTRNMHRHGKSNG